MYAEISLPPYKGWRTTHSLWWWCWNGQWRTLPGLQASAPWKFKAASIQPKHQALGSTFQHNSFLIPQPQCQLDSFTFTHPFICSDAPDSSQVKAEVLCKVQAPFSQIMDALLWWSGDSHTDLQCPAICSRVLFGILSWKPCQVKF